MINELVIIIILSGFAIFILLQSGKILNDSNRNAWDVLYLNSILAILTLFFIGLLAKDLEVWIFVVAVLGVVATGEKLSGVLQSYREKEGGSLTNIASFAKKIEGVRIHYLLLSFGFILVALSMILNRYFIPSFYLLIYAVGVIHIQLLRKQEWIDSLSKESRKWFYRSLFGFFVLWSLFWFWTLWRFLEKLS